MKPHGLVRPIRSRIEECLQDSGFRDAFIGGAPGRLGAVLARLPWLVAAGPTLDESGVALVLAVAGAPALIALVDENDQLCTLKSKPFAEAVLSARARLTAHLGPRQRARPVLAQLAAGSFAAATIHDGALALMTPIHPTLGMPHRRIYIASKRLEEAARLAQTRTTLARLARSQSDDLGF